MHIIQMLLLHIAKALNLFRISHTFFVFLEVWLNNLVVHDRGTIVFHRYHTPYVE